MYVRKVDSQELNFVVSGMLWNRSLVMRDEETDTLWSHILGEAMRGKLAGQRLEIVPSTMTDWATWRESHPETTVVQLRRTSRNYQREFYRDASRFVLGIAAEGQTPKAWSFDSLQNRIATNDAYHDVPVVIFFDKESKTAVAFDRRVESKLLSFTEQDDAAVDEESGSTWDVVTGRAIAGPLKGHSLKPLPAIVSYVTAWMAFHPTTVGLPEEIVQKATRRRSARGQPRRGRRAAMLDRLFEFDENMDGRVTPDELPRFMHKFIERGDSNDDGALDRREAERVLRRRRIQQ